MSTMHIVDIIILISYLVCILLVTRYTGLVRSIEDFTLASRSLPTQLVFVSLTAAYIGPGYTMGLAAKTHEHGLVYFVIFLFFIFQTILVGLYVAPKIQEYKNAYTIGDILYDQYGRIAKILAGVLSFAFCIGLVGTVAKAGGELFSFFTGIAPIYGILLLTIIVIAYSTYGGMRATVTTDILQFVFLSIFIPVILLIIMFKYNTTDLLGELPKSMLSFKGDFSNTTLVGLCVSFFVGESLTPVYVGRALMAKKPTSAKKGFLLSSAYGVVWFAICSVLGLLAKAIFPESMPDRVLLELMNMYLPIGILGFAVAGLIGVMMSTQDSFLNSGAVAFLSDIMFVDFSKKRFSKFTRKAQTANLLIGIGAVLFAITVPSLVDALLICYSIWGPTVVPVLVISILIKKAYKLSGVLAIIAGGITTLYCQFTLTVEQGIPPIIMGLIANQSTYWISHIILKNWKRK